MLATVLQPRGMGGRQGRRAVSPLFAHVSEPVTSTAQQVSTRARTHTHSLRGSELDQADLREPRDTCLPREQIERTYSGNECVTNRPRNSSGKLKDLDAARKSVPLTPASVALNRCHAGPSTNCCKFCSNAGEESPCNHPTCQTQTQNWFTRKSKCLGRSRSATVEGCAPRSGCPRSSRRWSCPRSSGCTARMHPAPSPGLAGGCPSHEGPTAQREVPRSCYSLGVPQPDPPAALRPGPSLPAASL